MNTRDLFMNYVEETQLFCGKPFENSMSFNKKKVKTLDRLADTPFIY